LFGQVAVLQQTSPPMPLSTQNPLTHSVPTVQGWPLTFLPTHAPVPLQKEPLTQSELVVQVALHCPVIGLHANWFAQAVWQQICFPVPLSTQKVLAHWFDAVHGWESASCLLHVPVGIPRGTMQKYPDAQLLSATQVVLHTSPLCWHA
jgi:hypothetical protein